MYLTAQLVRSPRGVEGINAALYRHREHDLPEGFWKAPDILHVAERAPGERTTAIRIEVAPGGNRIVGYLDIAAPEGTEETALVAALDVAERELRRGASCSIVNGQVAVRFSLDPAREPQALGIFQELRQQALSLYTDPRPPAWVALEPLRIEVGQTEGAWTFKLSPESAPRVHTALGSEEMITTITVPFDVASAFREIHGPLYPHVAEWVTGLSRERLLDLGGVQFVDGGQIVWEWPRRNGM